MGYIHVVQGIMVPVGNGWALFLSGGEMSLMGSCPRTGLDSPIKPPPPPVKHGGGGKGQEYSSVPPHSFHVF